MKNLLSLVFLFITVLTHAQIPSYVPSNGLVGWWPFNGNANDESGNGNNGTVNGATLSSDRDGVANNAFSFDNSEITLQFPSSNFSGDFTISIWVKISPNNASYPTFLMGNNVLSGETDPNFLILQYVSSLNKFSYYMQIAPINPGVTLIQTSGITIGDWYHLIIRGANQSFSMYINGALQGTAAPIFLSNAGNYLHIGNGRNAGEKFIGSLDDIGIWNRALTEAEILALYEGCQLAITTQPQDQSVTTSVGTASFTVASSSANATYQWQTNLGLGFQNISNAGQYNGVTTSSLTVSNLSMSNNNQVFRCIINDGSCVDTTAEASLTIIDDAGIQNNTLTTLKLYPNPAQDVLYIDGLDGKEFEYEVLSIEGKLLQKGKSQGEIAVKELKKGNYVLRIGQQQVAFVKQ